MEWGTNTQSKVFNFWVRLEILVLRFFFIFRYSEEQEEMNIRLVMKNGPHNKVSCVFVDELIINELTFLHDLWLYKVERKNDNGIFMNFNESNLRKSYNLRNYNEVFFGGFIFNEYLWVFLNERFIYYFLMWISQYYSYVRFHFLL